MKISLGKRTRIPRKPAALLLALALVTCRAVAQDRPGNPAGRVASGDTAQAHLGAGYENLRNNRYDAAAREFRAALALDPTLILQARFPLAVSLFELHRLDESWREFEAVRQAVGDHPNVEYYLGRLDLQEGKLDAAVRELNQAVAKPPFPDTAYYLGYAYLKQHDLAPAEKWLRRAAELSPRDAEVEYRLGTLYSEAGRKDEARQAFTRSQELRQREAEVDRLRVDCTEKLAHGSLQDARPVCAQLFDPEDAEKLTILGTLYGQHGNFEEALDPLRRAAELSPNSPQMQYNLAFDYFQLGRYAEAREPLAKAVERWPDLFPLNALYGVVLYKLGEAEPAYRALRHAHELNPQDPATANSLYEVTLRLAEKSLAGKQYSSALGYLNEAAHLRPDQPEPHRLLAEVYKATGQEAEAAAERRTLENLKTPGANRH
ncbi:MAG TPA: tetratricopeptide repeat protein [Terriglobia bacterium]|nr:tetratricopeptide repeat protein [Terriglobia bacterium]